jgi:GDP-D-mannose dehydratase
VGIFGQDCGHLRDVKIAHGYEVFGNKRGASRFKPQRSANLYVDSHIDPPSLVLHHGNLIYGARLARLLQQVHRDEVDSFGAQSHVAVDIGSLADHWAGHDTRAKNAWNLASPFQSA